MKALARHVSASSNMHNTLSFTEGGRRIHQTQFCNWGAPVSLVFYECREAGQGGEESYWTHKCKR